MTELEPPISKGGILELLHLRQNLTLNPEKTSYPSPTENHDLRSGGAGSPERAEDDLMEPTGPRHQQKAEMKS